MPIQITGLPINTVISEIFTFEEKAKLGTLSPYTASTSVVGEATQSGWHTIATLNNPKGSATFTIENFNDLHHDIVVFNASSAYGENSINVISANRYASGGVAHIRLLYSSIDRINGGAILQIYISSSFKFKITMDDNGVIDGGGFVLSTPVLDAYPLNSIQDDDAYIRYVDRYNSKKYYPTLINGWVNYDLPRAVYYRKDINGMVHIAGLVKNGVNNTCFTLPIGFRPEMPIYFTSYSSTGYAKIVVLTTGEVKFQASSLVYTSLNIPLFEAYN